VTDQPVGDSIWAERLRDWIDWTHQEVEASVRQVSPDLFRAQPAASAPSIAFHAWHIGRWVDRHIVHLSAFLDPEAPEPEVWTARDLATAWGLSGTNLGGYGGTGEGLDDDALAALSLPGVEEVLDYVVATFRTFDALLERIDEGDLERTLVDAYGDETSVAEMLLGHLSHADRHLGMIEALRGVLGERGTATQ
jgi:hypothetical protein